MILGNNIFEKASRLKLTFSTSRGVLSHQDLWDLPLQSSTGKVNLDEIARDLFRQIKSDDNISFVETNHKTDFLTQLMFDVVKHIIDTRLAEAKQATDEKERADKKQKLLAIIADRQDEKLRSMSLKDLQKMVAEL
jgi:hypothetical protein